jgi:hypothetical protein
VTTYLRDGKPDTEAIVAAVEAQLETLSRGISNNDADLIFGIFSTTKPTTYVRQGEIEQSVEAARESYRNSLAELQQKRTLTFLRKEFDVLDEKTVLFTGLGEITSAGQPRPWTIAYTMVFALEADAWKALNVHISWENEK